MAECSMLESFAFCRQWRELSKAIDILEESMPENFLTDRDFRRKYYAKHASGVISGLCFLAGFLVPALIFVLFFRYEQNGFVSFGYVLSTILGGLFFRFLYIQVFNACHKHALEDYHLFREKAQKEQEKNRALLIEKEAELLDLEAIMRAKKCAIPEQYWGFSWLLEEYVNKGKANNIPDAIALLFHDQRYVQRPKY